MTLKPIDLRGFFANLTDPYTNVPRVILDEVIITYLESKNNDYHTLETMEAIVERYEVENGLIIGITDHIPVLLDMIEQTIKEQVDISNTEYKVKDVKNNIYYIQEILLTRGNKLLVIPTPNILNMILIHNIDRIPFVAYAELLDALFTTAVNMLSRNDSMSTEELHQIISAMKLLNIQLPIQDDIEHIINNIIIELISHIITYNLGELYYEIVDISEYKLMLQTHYIGANK